MQQRAMNEYKEYRICIKAYDINLYEHAVKKMRRI
jgi:hypothetical protein